MSSKNLKSELKKEFAKVKTLRNPKITSDFDAVLVLSGESGDPQNPTKLHDTEERTKFGIYVFGKIKKLGGSPVLILNGIKTQNELMAQIAKKESVKKILLIKNPSFPKASTLTQFKELANLKFKKIVIVTHAYHGPRVLRYAKQYLPNECQYKLYLLNRDKINLTEINTEIKKILKYSQKGDLII